jgi:hypothetical protein
VISRIGRSVSIALLLAQEPSGELWEDYLATQGGSSQALVTLIAQHVDGTPVRGYIRCAGWWVKYEDDPARTFAGTSLPFETDARGAIVMNPQVTDEQIFCWSEDKGMRGEVSVDLMSRHVVVITLNRRAE